MNTIIPKWPRHVPTATLHDIILDSVFRDLPAEQIVSETLGLATPAMVAVYQTYVDRMMEDSLANPE